MGISKKTQHIIKKAFTGDLMVYSFFVYLLGVVNAMRVIFSMPNWMDVILWISFCQDVLLGDAFIILAGLLGNVLGNMKKDKMVKEHARVQRSSRAINNAYLKIQMAALTSVDHNVRMAARNEANRLISMGVSLWDNLDNLEKNADEVKKDLMDNTALIDDIEIKRRYEEMMKNIEEGKTPEPTEPPPSS